MAFRKIIYFMVLVNLAGCTNTRYLYKEGVTDEQMRKDFKVCSSQAIENLKDASWKTATEECMSDKDYLPYKKEELIAMKAFNRLTRQLQVDCMGDDCWMTINADIEALK